MMGTAYDIDVIAWANEQAALLRSGQLSALDIQHIAEEIEDVGKSEQRELASRMSVLLAHLLKWQCQPARRSNSWEATIRTQRASIERRIVRTPSLRASLNDPDWIADAYGDALREAVSETNLPLQDFPAGCPWTMAQICDAGFFPG